MAFRVDERASEFQVVDRFDGGVGWIAHPDEHMQRASHALVVDGDQTRSTSGKDVWVFDPVDAEGLDQLLAEYGAVAGVVVLLDRHTRDAAAIANRHDVPVYLPAAYEGVSEEIDAPVARFSSELSDTGFEAHTVVDNRFWQEVAIYDPERGTLLVPEAVGTVSYFLAGDERLGVHPMLRPVPPTDTLSGFAPERVLVGHGAGVTESAAVALEEALLNARRGAPRVYAGAVRRLFPV
ncbi:hypothetical protein C482_15151 [Natrialba chahannaoensis JCM 10990]|uniref:Beta-lactamase n=1 Tax=Natrialba chahannaoensis JCM 10990 TaxID=1227492 RepID=M0AH61_9EURY|nr:hypothetical protein [Natrialba chahannaoensis]ELY96723.1 hypothetical protein C482_15151 [Natrialba chahannaoensis JCM 10990]